MPEKVPKSNKKETKSKVKERRIDSREKKMAD